MGDSAGLMGQSFKRTGRGRASGQRVLLACWRAYEEENTRPRTSPCSFDALETLASLCSPRDDDVGDDIAERTAYAYLLSEAQLRRDPATPPPPDAAVLFMMYHPLVESHYSVLSCSANFPRCSSRELHCLLAPGIDGTGRLRRAPRGRAPTAMRTKENSRSNFPLLLLFLFLPPLWCRCLCTYRQLSYTR